MIKSILVFKKSGLCLFYKNFYFAEDEPHQYTGFFSAINIFSDNLFKEKINTISMGTSMINFRYHNDNIFVIISDKDADVSNIFNQLISNFVSEYTAEMDDQFKRDGKVPEFHYLGDIIEKCNEIPTFQRCIQ